MRRLLRQALVGCRQFGPEPGDGGGLALGLRLRGADTRLEREPAVAEACSALIGVLEHRQRRLQAGDLAGLVLSAGPERAQLLLAVCPGGFGGGPRRARARQLQRLLG
ncbi:MAG TPA: hypothetical protein VH913_04335, partial [Hyphomicrobiaceae bacterium]